MQKLKKIEGRIMRDSYFKACTPGMLAFCVIIQAGTAQAQHIDIRWDPSGQLTIYGTHLNDEIRVHIEEPFLRFHFRTVGGNVPWWAEPTSSGYANYRVLKPYVNKILFFGYAGDDRFTHDQGVRDSGLPRVELYGGDGNDRLYGSVYNDFINGGGEDDDIHSFAGSDVLFGDVGNDQLYGGSGDDFLCGGGGADWLYGENGNDWIFRDSSDRRVHFGNGSGDRGFDEPCSYWPIFVAGYWVPGEGLNYGLFFADRGIFVFPGADVPFFEFGLYGDQPIVWDWNNDGIDDAGVVRNGVLYQDIGPRGYQGVDPREYIGIPW